MAWFSLAKIALQAGSKIYSNRQKTKMAMSDAQLMHAEKKKWPEVRKLTKANYLKRDKTIIRTNLCSYNFSAHRGVNVGSDVGRSDCDGEGKIVLRVFS